MLIGNQVTRDYAAHHPTIGLYLNKAKALLKKFVKYEIMQIPKGENSHADALAGIASNVDYSLRQTIFFEYLEAPSVHKMEPEVVAVINAQENWMDEIIDYIQEGKVPEDHNLARKLIQKALRYTVIYRKIYQRSYSELHSLCVMPKVG